MALYPIVWSMQLYMLKYMGMIQEVLKIKK